MACSLNMAEVMGYTAGERARWEHWFQSQPPTVVDASVQKEGDFQDVWRLIDHIFLVEKRHGRGRVIQCCARFQVVSRRWRARRIVASRIRRSVTPCS